MISEFSVEVRVFDCCPACGTEDTKIIFRPLNETKGKFCKLNRVKYQGYMGGWDDVLDLKIAQCLRCLHLWHHTQPDHVSLLGMYQAGVPLKVRQSPSYSPTAAMLRKMKDMNRLMLKRGVLNPRLLDYGSGKGRWARAAFIAGFQVCAFEPSDVRSSPPAGIDTVPTVHILDDLSGKKFDLINLEQVLEHLQDPYKALNALRVLCEPHTILRVSVPDISRHQSGIWEEFPFDGKKMHIMSPYEHLQGFNPRSLAALLDRAGLVRDLGFAIWHTHPIYAARSIIGMSIPGIAHTLSLARYAS